MARDGGASGTAACPRGTRAACGVRGLQQAAARPRGFCGWMGGVGENVCTPNAMAGNPQHAGESRRRSSWDWALAWDLNTLPPARSVLFWGLGRAWDQNGFPRPCARGRRPELRGVPPGPGWLRLSVSLRPIAGLLAAARARGVVEAAERNSPRDGRPRGLRTAVRQPATRPEPSPIASRPSRASGRGDERKGDAAAAPRSFRKPRVRPRSVSRGSGRTGRLLCRPAWEQGVSALGSEKVPEGSVPIRSRSFFLSHPRSPFAPGERRRSQ